jgi:FKBP-type peptidyl-prolyl cis-trans isomerase 2
MQKGDFIRVAFSGKLKETGQALDKAESAPVVVGEKWVIPGVDEALEGMNVGDKKTVEIAPEKAFGPRNPKLVKLVPEAEFRKHGTKPTPGLVVNADNRRGRILSVSSGRVKIDFNHPLAGKMLEYDLEIKEKLENNEDKIKAVVEFYSRVFVKDLKVTEVYLKKKETAPEEKKE